MNTLQQYGCALIIACLALPGPGRAQTNDSSVTAEQVNEAFGMPLWADDSLWENNIDDVARRLGARLESEAGAETSYTARPALVLGVRPENVRLTGREGKAFSVMIMFANKGDTLGVRPDSSRMPSIEYQKALAEFRKKEQNLSRTIKIQNSLVEDALKNLLGEYSKQRFGEGDKTSEWVKTWTWKSHAILLAEAEGASLSLRIVPLEAARARGKSEKTSDADLKAQLKARVLKRDNGDVIVTEIPMISQGRKGYCVPATWARYLRYMGIQADEYVLANAAQTKKGGGTSSGEILAATTALANQNRRSVKKICNQITIPTVSAYINSGLPLMWRMYSIGPFELCDRRADRMGGQSPEEWKAALKPYRKAAKGLKLDPEQRHMCMIIGYNALTGEIATSDSWGLEHAEKWYTVEEVQAVTGGEMYLVAW